MFLGLVDEKPLQVRGWDSRLMPDSWQPGSQAAILGNYVWARGQGKPRAQILARKGGPRNAPVPIMPPRPTGSKAPTPPQPPRHPGAEPGLGTAAKSQMGSATFRVPNWDTRMTPLQNDPRQR
jgi:hypothetical protein